ncbi:2Fe-2S iron-sulfur cluster-binding protein [Natronorubrum texcoconense]|uniref:Ferredoxin n=1 Tax=Natronorubrum texcoconense TaxID=1095776 RepID=A0A1G9GJ00_9EURY|nr:2Fe-2S iron-sulfur cluster-binding protein [Natronorubrum texcoconense]SDL00253.1 ferredoxin [Natronorubrum texcoconense]
MTGHDVTLEWPDGRTERVAVGPRETVLEVAGREGIRLPYDCRKGTCTACVGRLRAIDEDGAEPDAAAGDGDRATDPIDAAAAFDYRRAPTALTDREQRAGYVLLCIALVRTDCRVEVGPRVRSEVGGSPWS